MLFFVLFYHFGSHLIPITTKTDTEAEHHRTCENSLVKFCHGLSYSFQGIRYVRNQLSPLKGSWFGPLLDNYDKNKRRSLKSKEKTRLTRTQPPLPQKMKNIQTVTNNDKSPEIFLQLTMGLAWITRVMNLIATECSSIGMLR